MLILAAPVSPKCEPGTPVSFEACLQHYFGDSVIDDFACGVCQAKTTCTKRVRFVTFPQVLVTVLAREVYDDWVPKKLEVDLQLQEDPLNFEIFGASGPQPGEQEMPVAEEFEEPQLNGEIVQMLVEMGIPPNAAKHAVYNT
jgi:ubiquitin carboxyl-terminal hydrolase 5/13